MYVLPVSSSFVLRVPSSLLSLGAVAVHAAVSGLPAGLPSHSAPHLHRQARLCTPLDSAAQLLTSCFCKQIDTCKRRGRGWGRQRDIDCQSMTLNPFVTHASSCVHRVFFWPSRLNHLTGKTKHRGQSELQFIPHWETMIGYSVKDHFTVTVKQGH